MNNEKVITNATRVEHCTSKLFHSFNPTIWSKERLTPTSQLQNVLIHISNNRSKKKHKNQAKAQRQKQQHHSGK
jgi:hypothetical protein